MPEKRTSGSFPEDNAAAEKNAAGKTLGNRALSVCGRGPPHPPGISSGLPLRWLGRSRPAPAGSGWGRGTLLRESRPVPVRVFPRIAGNRSGCGWLPQPSGACRFVMARQRPRFSEESLIQRSSRRTASPSIKRPAEGREAPGWTPPTAFPLKSAAIRGRSQGRRRRLQRPCCRPWCPRVRWPARCCP